jgi:hypothetical protein
MRSSASELQVFENGEAAAGGAQIKGESIKKVVGDPDKPGMYSIILKVPPHTKIAAHFHPDDRIATVLSGSWNFGYGEKFDAKKLKALPPGSVYTEPAKQAHFAETGDEAAVVEIIGVGPSGTTYIDKK